MNMPTSYEPANDSSDKPAQNRSLPPLPKENKTLGCVEFFVLFWMWLLTLSLLGIALLRLVYHDGNVPLIWLNAFTRYIYLPAYFTLGFSLWRKRKRLAVVAAIVVGFHLFWIVPDYIRESPLPLPAAYQGKKTRDVTIYLHNVHATSTAYTATFQELLQAKPDIAILLEYHPDWHRALLRAGINKKFIYDTIPQGRFTGWDMMLSQLPMKKVKRHWLTGRPLLDVTLDVEGTLLRVICVHSPRPILDDPKNKYQTYFKKLLKIIDENKLPLIVIGDFNATQHSYWYRQLTQGPLRSAHALLGKRSLVSWPNGKDFAPPILIDHAFVSKEIECLSIETGEGIGSDHKPLLLKIRVQVPEAKSRTADRL